MWTYYKQTYPSGVWLLFREMAGARSETYHRTKGWMQNDDLEYRKHKGEVDESDIITEQEAFALIQATSDE